MVIISKLQFVAVALANAVVLAGDLVETLTDLVSGDLIAAAQSLILGLV
ncbi:hypothetical protein [Marivivens niveibacter]|nr:hypothetical protein [Marivivens niveibacter]